MKLGDKRGQCLSLFCEVTMKSTQLLLLSGLWRFKMARGLRHSWPEGLYHWHLLVEIIICHHGIPDELLSDRGANCLSERIQICKELGVKKVNTSGYHPQTDRLVEKFNPTLINVIAKYCEKWNHDWDQHLSYLLLHTYRVSSKEWNRVTFLITLPITIILEVYHTIYDLSSTCNCWNSKGGDYHPFWVVLFVFVSFICMFVFWLSAPDERFFRHGKVAKDYKTSGVLIQYQKQTKQQLLPIAGYHEGLF